MFFFLSKIFWAVFTPLTFISLMAAGGWMMRKCAFGQRILGTGIILLILCGFFPVGHNILVYRESKYPPMENFPDKVDGIIVLGGSIDFRKSLNWGQGQLNEHAPRITEMMYLSYRYPNAKMIFSGGNGNIGKSLSSESVELSKLLKKINFNDGRVVYESTSRNTYENVVFSKNLINPRKGDVWLLVTSAFHMERSEAIFRSQGWNVTPCPAGYLSNREYRYSPDFEVLENMYKLQIATKEIIGMIAYTLTGKIKSDDPISVTSGLINSQLPSKSQ